MGHFPPLFRAGFRYLSHKSHNFSYYLYYVYVCMYVCMYVTIYSYIHTYILFMPFTVNVMGLMGQMKKSLIP
jgi:hypothetical protein